ncbi:MAG: filamentous hemagglutinin N-terminal domain-containing protein, partial [Verrucomicrobia bacterium]|nr:filamentous hemagglutinin N-terminal domain-containing protein [Verrucomicrobiota bacterium]
MPALLLALPTNPEVVSGSANISQPDQNSMVIEVSDQSIINYQSFNVGAEEMVRFVQPSTSSVVLNRVTGKEGSEILGKMESNGKVFLVNPNGVFFGADAQVDMGSLITSTLDIADNDFLNGNFEFTLQTGDQNAEIVNMGTLRAKGDGSVALISPNVRNEGTIVAKTGKVLLASGEKVVLDFVGDGLMQFSVEGSLEKSLIEQAGDIQALQGSVHLTMGHVKQVIQNVINADGIVVGNEIIEEMGVIKLVDSSSISSKAVQIAGVNGSKVEINGSIDASNTDGIGGSIYVFGEEISLNAAHLNASGSVGGGEILIGGNAFGQGTYFTSQNTRVHPGSSLIADATILGDGGKVVVWSNEITYFDGLATAQGGVLGGNGGFVETSGKMGLALATGRVDTSASLGSTGNWLLDPFAIVVNNTGTSSLESAQDATDITSTVTINAAIFSDATSNVVLSAMAEG